MLAAGLSLTVRPCDQPVLAVDHESEVVVGNDPGRPEPDSRIRLQIECHAEEHLGRGIGVGTVAEHGARSAGPHLVAPRDRARTRSVWGTDSDSDAGPSPDRRQR